jgi:hypothetical protein
LPCIYDKLLYKPFTRISFFAAIAFRYFCLYFELRGVNRSLSPQHGHHIPSQKIKILQELHLFCPISYRPNFLGFNALYLSQIRLHEALISKNPHKYFVSDIMYDKLISIFYPMNNF